MRKLAAALALLASPALAQDVTPAPEDQPGPYLDIAVAGEANGTVTIDLFAEAAPDHTAQILALAGDGAYDNVVFHRVIEGFMAQTGDVEHGVMGADMRLAGTGGSDRPDLKAEFTDTDFARGVVGMARSRHPDSANSQFFIMFDAAPHLNGQYTAIGKVVSGIEVVDAIKKGTGPNGAVIGQPDRMESVAIRSQ